MSISTLALFLLPACDGAGPDRPGPNEPRRVTMRAEGGGEVRTAWVMAYADTAGFPPEWRRVELPWDTTYKARPGRRYLLEGDARPGSRTQIRGEIPKGSFSIQVCFDDRCAGSSHSNTAAIPLRREGVVPQR